MVPCQNVIVSTLRRIKTTPCQKRCRIRMMPCQHVALATRPRDNTTSCQQRNRVSDTPHRDGAASTRRRPNNRGEVAPEQHAWPCVRMGRGSVSDGSFRPSARPSPSTTKGRALQGRGAEWPGAFRGGVPNGHTVSGTKIIK